MTTAIVTHQKNQNGNTRLRGRAEQLIRTEIDFIPNREFASEGLHSRGLVEELISSTGGPAPISLPPHLRRLCSTELLTHEVESMLFREMNLLKFQANVLRSRLDPMSATEREIEAIENRLAQANAIRDHIIQANVRLVMSIAKKFVTPRQSFDETLSDGIVTLMQAVEKFDFDRGFRFSTYAYRSVARSAYRSVIAARKEEARFTQRAKEWAFEQEDGQLSSTLTDQVWSNVRGLMFSMLDKLDRREQFIIRGRFALGAHRKVRTFQYLADKLGVSKERVRQIEQRAVSKLRTMAGELEMDDLFSAAMV